MKEISDVEIIIHMNRLPPHPSSGAPSTLTNIEFFLDNNKVSGAISRDAFVTLNIDKRNVKIGKNNFRLIFSYSIGGTSYYSFSESPLTIYRDSKFNAYGLDGVNLFKVGKEEKISCPDSCIIGESKCDLHEQQTYYRWDCEDIGRKNGCGTWSTIFQECDSSDST